MTEPTQFRSHVPPDGRRRARRWPSTVTVAAALLGGVACQPDTIKPPMVTEAPSDVYLAPVGPTDTTADPSTGMVKVTFDVMNVGGVSVDVVKIDLRSQPGMDFVSALPEAVILAPGKAITVTLTYVITDCDQAMSVTGPVPVIVKVTGGTTTTTIEPNSQPNESWERSAAEQVCDVPPLVQTSP